jgi:hypothetical protein
MYCRRLPKLAACIIALAAVVGAQEIQAENWTYRADLGGWLDNETGLVWGQSSRVWNPSVWYSHSGAVNVGIPAYRQMTGNPKWRLPTLAESQAAYAHNAYTYLSQTGDTSVAPAWTSNTQGKKSAWVFWISTGQTMQVGTGSSAAIRPVYRP